ncbi:MAG: ATP-binding cassette domain-containing protein [Oscillospiraceae bacterium]|nr:ATP-binding cassette domain-containing protein [Oscillospiraceae bacterium]MDD4368072.1 ATP-binding cassette domain-containing protein [Oscillospiraceae bacterium]
MSLSFRQLSFRYFPDGPDVISQLSGEIPDGRITVLAGPSGQGKSTLLYLTAGLYPDAAGQITSGQVLINGEDPAALPPRQRCHLTGLLFQNPDLQFCLDTVENELAFCLENLALPPAAITAAVAKAVDFAGLSALRQRQLVTLSGGEKQRVALACLRLLQPRWLLLDEPLANLDAASGRCLLQRLRRWQQEAGFSVLAVDHRIENWLDYADELCLLRPDGSLSAPQPFPQQPQERQAFDSWLQQHGLIVPGRPYREQADRLQTSVPWPAASAAVAAGAGMPQTLVLQDLTLQQGSRYLLRQVKASFQTGKVYALLGPSGCGKSTLLRAILGLNRYQGNIWLEGKRLKPGRPPRPGSLGLITQSPQDQFVGGSVWEEISAGQPDSAASRKQAETVLRQIRLWRFRDLSPYQLSQGQQRRLGVASLLLAPCRVLLCDEPTYAQDLAATLTLMAQLLETCRKGGRLLIFTTHDRRLAFEYADEVLEIQGETLQHAQFES